MMASNIRLMAVDRVQNKSEGLVYFDNNAETWNVVIQERQGGRWVDADLVYVDPNYTGKGEKATKIK